MTHLLDEPLARVAEALRKGDISSAELTGEAIRRHRERGGAFGAYKHFDAEGAAAAARAADRRLSAHRRGSGDAPPLCGIPVSVKDLYGVRGLPTFAGTARRLPERWERDGWLVGRLRAQGAVFTGKTHTVEMAYGAVGVNPHWGTPRNPWDPHRARVPGGSSSGAGVSLHEGSALVALGSDTGGSIRIPASMTGTVGHKTTKGRWPTDGVVPLSATLDTVGALTRSAADSLFFFGAVDPAWGDPAALQRTVPVAGDAGLRIGVPRSDLWDDCQEDVAAVLHHALGELRAAGWRQSAVDGRLVDAAEALYLTGTITGAECRTVLEEELPGWMEILDPIVGRRLARAPSMGDPAYGRAQEERRRLAAAAASLFEGCDVLALPGALATPPLLAEMEDLSRYALANNAALRPTCPASILGLCAVTLPVGLDAAGMPVGLQLVAPGGGDEALLGLALAAERVLGRAEERLGPPPGSGSPPGASGP